jgi:hypothetical protein
MADLDASERKAQCLWADAVGRGEEGEEDEGGKMCGDGGGDGEWEVG